MTRLDAIHETVDYLTTLGAFVQTVRDPRLRAALCFAMLAIVEDAIGVVEKWAREKR